MKSIDLKHQQKARRISRIRQKLQGTSERPRLIVIISNRNVSSQIIDDTAAKTLVSADSSKSKSSLTLTEKAAAVGADVAKSAQTKKIKSVVFDRRGRIYHGRVKAFAEAARAAGLEF